MAKQQLYVDLVNGTSKELIDAAENIFCAMNNQQIKEFIDRMDFPSLDALFYIVNNAYAVADKGEEV